MVSSESKLKYFFKDNIAPQRKKKKCKTDNNPKVFFQGLSVRVAYNGSLFPDESPLKVFSILQLFTSYSPGYPPVAENPVETAVQFRRLGKTPGGGKHHPFI